jgi:hypothetical protein
VTQHAPVCSARAVTVRNGTPAAAARCNIAASVSTATTCAPRRASASAPRPVPAPRSTTRSGCAAAASLCKAMDKMASLARTAPRQRCCSTQRCHAVTHAPHCRRIVWAVRVVFVCGRAKKRAGIATACSGHHAAAPQLVRIYEARPRARRRRRARGVAAEQGIAAPCDGIVHCVAQRRRHHAQHGKQPPGQRHERRDLLDAARRAASAAAHKQRHANNSALTSSAAVEAREQVTLPSARVCTSAKRCSTCCAGVSTYMRACSAHP